MTHVNKAKKAAARQRRNAYALVEIARIHHLRQVIRRLVAAGSRDAKSIEEAAALLDATGPG